MFKSIKTWQAAITLLGAGDRNPREVALWQGVYQDPPKVSDWLEFVEKLLVVLNTKKEPEASLPLPSEPKEEAHKILHPNIPSWQSAKLFTSQLKATVNAWERLFGSKNYRGVLLSAGTGSGKTWVAGQLITWALDIVNGIKLSDKTYGPHPVMFITKAPVVDKTKEDLLRAFNINCVTDCKVCSYDSLRSSFGTTLYIQKKIIVESGVQRVKWKWNPGIVPALVICDEIQAAKNESSAQSQITCALGEAQGIKFVGMSATPFSRVSEAKATILNFHIRYDSVNILSSK
jgi:hypothetical protein